MDIEMRTGFAATTACRAGVCDGLASTVARALNMSMVRSDWGVLEDLQVIVQRQFLARLHKADPLLVVAVPLVMGLHDLLRL